METTLPAGNNSEEKFTFFWERKSPFSQWHSSRFVVDGVSYNCAEQFMMHRKAVYFSDRSSAKEIMKTSDPKQQKALGRGVKGFDAAKWDAVSKDIVKRGNLAKFSQNEDLRQQLFATEGTTLVETSPVDRIWGIGLAADDPRAGDRTKWFGENRLGQALTEVRQELLMHESAQKETIVNNAKFDSSVKTEDTQNGGARTKAPGTKRT